jgi:hypothetical protein
MSDISVCRIRHIFKNQGGGDCSARSQFGQPFSTADRAGGQNGQRPEKHKFCFSSPQLFKDFWENWQATL